MKDNHDWEDEDSVVQNLTCILITGIQDPVRDEVSSRGDKREGRGIQNPLRDEVSSKK